MGFIRRNKFLLLTMAVLLLAAVMALRQFKLNEQAHVNRREDFILLDQRQEQKGAEFLYQRLIQELPDVSDLTLIDDLNRTLFLVEPNQTKFESLIGKYHVSVKNELLRRSERRVERALKRANEP